MRVDWSRIIAVFLLLVILLLVALKVIYFQWFADGGIAIGESYRIVRGEKLYSEISSYWMPMTNWTLATAFRTFGESIYVVQVLAGGLYIGVLYFVFRVSRALNLSITYSLVSVILFLLVSVAPSVNHNWVALVITGLIVARLEGYELSLFKVEETNIKGVLIGVLIGVLVFTNLWHAAAVILGLAGYLVTSLLLREKLIRVTFSVGLGVFVPLLLVTCYLLLSGDLVHFIGNTILFPVTHYASTNAAFVASPLLYSTGIFYLYYFCRHRQDLIDLDSFERLIALVGVSYLIVSLINPSHGHVSLGYLFAAPLFIRAIVSRLEGCKLRSLQDLKVERLSRSNLGTVVVVIFFISGILTVAKSSIRDMMQPHAWVETQKESVLAPENYQAVLQDLNVLEINLDDEPMFIAPWAAELYFLLDLEPMVSYTYMSPEHNTQKVQQEIIDQLKALPSARVLYVSSLSMTFPETPHTLEQYLQEDYELVYPFAKDSDNKILQLDGVWVRAHSVAH